MVVNYARLAAIPQVIIESLLNDKRTKPEVFM